MFNNPLTTDQQITICGAGFPNSTSENKFGKIVVRGKDYNGQKPYEWKWDSEKDDLCKDDRYNFKEMIIAFKTKKVGEKKDLSQLVEKMELFSSSDKRGIGTMNIKDTFKNDYPEVGEQCVHTGIGRALTTKWTDFSNNFSQFINSKKKIKSISWELSNSKSFKKIESESIKNYFDYLTNFQRLPFFI